MYSDNNRLDQMEWSKEFNVNVIEIDEKHYDIFCRLRNLTRDIKRSRGSADLMNALDELIDHSVSSFKVEELYFDKFSYDNKAPHHREHEEMLSLLYRFKEEYDASHPLLNLAAVESFGRAIMGHITSSDKVFGDFVKKTCMSRFMRASG